MTDAQILKAMQTMLEPIKEDLSVLKQDVSGLKQDVSTLKQDMVEVKQELSEVKTRVMKIEIRQENEISPRIQLLVEAQQDNALRFKTLDRVEKTLDEVKSDTEVIKDVITQHSRSIQELKLVK